jgi:hypothetical protein
MGLSCSEQELVALHTDAIKDQAPEYGRGRWCEDESSQAGVGEDAFKTYLYANNAPGLFNFLALLKHFGKAYGDQIVEVAGYHLHRIGEAPPNMPENPEFFLALAQKLDATADDFRKRAAGIKKGGRAE